MKNSDITSFTRLLLDTIKKQLDALAEEQYPPLVHTSKAKTIVKTQIVKLKNFVYAYTFKSPSEEIAFFKELKPLFYSQYYYYCKLLDLNLNEPLADRISIENYFKTELTHLYEFIQRHREFYTYSLSGYTHLDDKYFTRCNTISNDLEIDRQFSTGFDNLLAMIMANQMLKEYLTSALKKLQPEQGNVPSCLKWTASKTSLIELLYALQSAEALNYGKYDLKQVASCFEAFFDVKLGNYYRVFQDIRLRKNGRTNFLDQLKENFTQRMDEFD